MRTRRHFQPSLDGMPIRIAPSGGLLKAAVIASITTGPVSTEIAPSEGLRKAAGIAPPGGLHRGEGASSSAGGIHADDCTTDPSQTITGTGSIIIIDPVTVPTTLTCSARWHRSAFPSVDTSLLMFDWRR